MVSEYISNIFMMDKGNWQFIIIWNLKKLNSSMIVEVIETNFRLLLFFYKKILQA